MTDRLYRPHFSRPVRQVVSMLIVLGLVGGLVFLAAPRILPVFLGNPRFNGFIVAVFVIGVLSCFWQVGQLMRSVRWIERFTTEGVTREQVQAPQLLAPLATLLRSREAQMQLTATSTRSILDSVGTRIEEDREITRYIVNALIFLGLLGTFYGLATTVPALVETIRGLAPRDGESGIAVFTRLMSGLEEQLSGMGVAFASSLLGLAGSLVVSLLELFAGHGQNRFYRELEEWLSSITKLGMSGIDDSSSDRDVIIAVMQQMSEHMEMMQQVVGRADLRRAEADGRLSEALSAIVDRQEALMAKLSDDVLDGGLDAESRMRLRSIDVQLLRIMEELSTGRLETLADLRSELAQMTDALTRARRQPSPLGD